VPSAEEVRRRRWPGWVYEGGEEPDYRFSFANERTFLAWIRTSLALLAGGVALDTVPLDLSDGLRRALAVLLIALGLTCAVAAWVRWARAERAMRRGEPMPSVLVSGVLTVALVVAAVAVLVALLLH
jgi:putative membrane protein